MDSTKDLFPYVAPLEVLLEQQMEFNSRVWGAEWQRSTPLSKDLALGLMSEVFELLDNLGWKIHRQPVQGQCIEGIKEELADIFKYLLCLCQVWGCSFEELVRRAYWKTRILSKDLQDPIPRTTGSAAIIDLDGVLVDFRAGIQNLGYTIHNPKAQRMYQFLEIPPDVAELLKSQLYSSDLLADFPPLGSPKLLTSYLKARGFNVYITTHRPVHLWKSLSTVTLQWLEANEVHYDGVLWLIDRERTAQRWDLCFEDDPDIITQLLRSSKAHVFVPRQPYNTIFRHTSTRLSYYNANEVSSATAAIDAYLGREVVDG